MLADKPLISPIRIVDTASGAISYNTVFMRILFSKISNVSLVLLLDVLIINELSLTGITSDEADLITYSEFSSVPVRLILLSAPTYKIFKSGWVRLVLWISICAMLISDAVSRTNNIKKLIDR